MRKTIGGFGTDTTSATLAYLQAGNQFRMADLILIGEAEDPLAHWLTSWDAPLFWAPYGTFKPAIFKRGSIATKIGLEVDKIQFEWSPPVTPATNVVTTTSPYQRANIGYYDNMRFRLWRVFMPTPGDCGTYGACEMFGGRIQGCSVVRGRIRFTVNSFLDVANQDVPTNVIELTNPLPAYLGATPPFHSAVQLSAIPQFAVHSGTTQTKLILAQASPNPGQIFNDNELRDGFVVFNKGSGKTLSGVWKPIYANTVITISSLNYNEIVLYDPLPWVPTPGVDTCFISGAYPLNDGLGTYYGFPFVPAPASAL